MSKKPKWSKCTTKHCRNHAARRPDGRSYGGKCHACRSASWRENQPMRAAYHRLKSHAFDRGIEFSISFDYFRKFAERTRLLTRRGQHGESLTVDRKDNLLGYEPGNIQPLTRAKNSEKRNKQDKIRMQKGYGWAVPEMYGAFPF